MRVMITGGDGFIGWPTALRLSNKGHAVFIVDNYLRRRLTKSLTPIVSLADRSLRWEELTGRRIDYSTVNCCDHELLRAWVEDFEPDAIIHLAVQPSAPYSMRSADTKMETVENNVLATTGVLIAASAAKRPPHVIHIGTMGVYGYGAVPGMMIPEGYVEATMQGHTQEILHPTSPGSLYHATKVLDQTLFAFWAKNDGLRITDLHQGIVWGTQTPETKMDDILINRFDYDGDFGTVLNRFIMQAAIGYPLTVHGTGEQTRAFININDTVACLEIALDNPPARGERVRIMNQMTEVHQVRDLAMMVSRLTGATIASVDNPRKEAPANSLSVINTTLCELGLQPTLLADGLIEETRDIASYYKDRADIDRIICTSRWVA